MADCWACSETGSWKRRPNRARFVVLLRIGNGGEIRLLCGRHAVMQDEPTTLIIDIDDWFAVDLPKHGTGRRNQTIRDQPTEGLEGPETQRTRANHSRRRRSTAHNPRDEDNPDTA